jgi:translocation and assembly module TamB
MFRDRQVPVLTNMFDGLRVTVPIGGTLANPQVDKDAFNLAMQDLGKSLLDRVTPQGAVEFFQRLFPPRDPNLPPPPTLQERRMRRQERLQERRMPP